MGARRRNALVGFRGCRASRREALTTGRLGLGDGLGLLLLLGGSDLGRMVFVVVVGGRNVVGITFAVRFGAIAAGGRGVWGGRGEGSDAHVTGCGRDLGSVITVIEVGWIGRHGRRADGAQLRVGVGIGEDLDGVGGDGLVVMKGLGSFVNWHRLYRCARDIVIVEQFGVGGLVGVVKATR